MTQVALFLIAFALFCIALGIDGLSNVLEDFFEELKENDDED